ncbi:hypothetical protein AK812_SmicGene4592 [Symbiodinium microadriaticum]|uniref:Uncharacterized protein n=1 Tax=Symbiodinium microadriaticum TaxID=2951 RepID=A0A1Q9EVU0_SYMMI|nr:hypothetical protein AK812_SmicGene4592 [Symbiodinium microadriaticum]
MADAAMAKKGRRSFKVAQAQRRAGVKLDTAKKCTELSLGADVVAVRSAKKLTGQAPIVISTTRSTMDQHSDGKKH